MKKLMALIAAVLMFSAASCEKPSPEPEPEPQPETAVFAKGADVSWVTQMEKDGCKFYDSSGKQSECMALLKSLGMDAIRLRVWVNPEGGWCGKDDVLVKAKRAKALGMRLMIDFHYSDWWADPGKQNKPAAWKDLDLEGLKKAVADHTTDILTALKDAGIAPEWIQIGNETTGGMLWPDGQNYTDAGFASYVQLHNSGYDAAKAVFPSAKVMVHVDNGWKWETLKWFFNSFDIKGGKFDLIGLSLYPEKSNWQSYNKQTLENISTLYTMYGKPSIICEVGMEWQDASTCRDFLADLISRAKAEDSHCTGVLYWEPEGYQSWSHYSKAAFDNSGKPTAALDAFKD
ncbi:MAG: arabinogalactan endo-1,4-beta-galactosidase [Bacteroidales bacterium]|nr:arabinogalactan endo-1,4-beta-galactosidase [Bacteroidales bacterium]